MVGWDGVGWDWMGWDGIRDGAVQGGVCCYGMWWGENQSDRMLWDGMELKGVVRLGGVGGAELGWVACDEAGWDVGFRSREARWTSWD